MGLLALAASRGACQGSITMSDFYKPNRGPDWNYGGGRWKLSRSKIDLFKECPRCFYIDNKLGTKRVPGYPFALNSAVDYMLKQEFDIHRANGEQHPLQKEYGLVARPVAHEQLDEWRRNFGGIRCFHEQTGLTVTGAIDDLWINDEDEYIVVDYKATAKEEPVTALDKEWHGGYKRQMEVYQWLLRQNNLKVSDTGYFVYCTGKLDQHAFDKRIDFDVNLIPYTGTTDWVEPTLHDIKRCLVANEIPPASPKCDWCAYREAVSKHEKA